MEKRWVKWMHNQPFDTLTGERLASELQKRLQIISVKDDPNQHRYLKQQLKLTQNRTERYKSMQKYEM